MILARLVFLMLSIVAISACALIEVDKRTTYQDINGDPTTDLLRKVRKKITTREWLLAQFEEPIHVQKLKDNKEILTWRFSRTQKNTTSIFIFFKARSAKYQKEYLHVLLHNNIVKKRWLDKYEHADAGEYGEKIPVVKSKLMSPQVPSFEQTPVQQASIEQDIMAQPLPSQTIKQKTDSSHSQLHSLVVETRPKTILLSPKFNAQ